MTAPTALAPKRQVDEKTILHLVTDGNCARLNAGQKLQYYRSMCQAAGVDWRTAPFEFVNMNGRVVLYAKKACTNQMQSARNLSATFVNEDTLEGGIYKVTARVENADPSQMKRATDDFGCVSIKGLTGNDLCNALMKAATKAKRRAVLSHCGIGLMDESEVSSVKGAKVLKTEITDEGIEVEGIKEAEAVTVESTDEPAVIVERPDDNASLDELAEESPPAPPPPKPKPRARARKARPAKMDDDPDVGEFLGLLQDVTGRDVNIKNGPNAGTVQTGYTIETRDGERFGTFKEEAANVALDLCKEEKEVRIKYRVNGKYKNVIFVEPA